jgi:TetR/AcrR family transcriptional regulator
MNESHNTDKHTQILDAAQKRFAHYGLSKVTMDEIAGDLHMSKAALYYYFKTKEEVFREVIAREQLVFIDFAETILQKNTSAVTKFRNYCRHRLQYLNQLANLKLIGTQSWMDVRPLIVDMFQSFKQKEIDFIIRILKEGKENREFHVKSTEKTAELMLHVLHGMAMHIYKPFDEFSSNEQKFKILCDETDELMDLILNGLNIR